MGLPGPGRTEEEDVAAEVAVPCDLLELLVVVFLVTQLEVVAASVDQLDDSGVPLVDRIADGLLDGRAERLD